MSLELPSSSVILLSGQCHLHHHRSCGCPCLLSACRGKYPIAGTRIDLFALFQFPSFLPTYPQFNFHVAPEGKQQLGFLERRAHSRRWEPYQIHLRPITLRYEISSFAFRWWTIRSSLESDSATRFIRHMMNENRNVEVVGLEIKYLCGTWAKDHLPLTILIRWANNVVRSYFFEYSFWVHRGSATVTANFRVLQVNSSKSE